MKDHIVWFILNLSKLDWIMIAALTVTAAVCGAVYLGVPE